MIPAKIALYVLFGFVPAICAITIGISAFMIITNSIINAIKDCREESINEI